MVILRRISLAIIFLGSAIFLYPLAALLLGTVIADVFSCDTRTQGVIVDISCDTEFAEAIVPTLMAQIWFMLITFIPGLVLTGLGLLMRSIIGIYNVERSHEDALAVEAESRFEFFIDLVIIIFGLLPFAIGLLIIILRLF